MKHSNLGLRVFVSLIVASSAFAQQSGPARQRGRQGSSAAAASSVSRQTMGDPSNDGPVQPAEPASPAATADPAAVRTPPLQAVPRLIKFNGTVRDLAGKPIAGPVDVTFALYTDEAGGSPLWFEMQTVQADSLGRYTVLLGAMTTAGIPIELFTSGEAHWLGTQVSNLPEQSRVLLVSVPYAMKAGDAETLGGKPASAFILAG